MATKAYSSALASTQVFIRTKLNKSFSMYIIILSLLILRYLDFDVNTYRNTSLSLQQAQNSSRSRVITKNITYGTALCCIAIDEEAYIDEFIDYYHALGFDSIHVYDNSDENALKQWGEEKGNHVKVVHYPGIAKQQSAYLDCAKKIKEDGNYTWVAFFDIDEFLILKKHENIEDFLLDYLSCGSLAINWFMFLTSGRIEYSPLPVTKRFLHRGDNVNQHVKCIVKLSDMNMKKEPTAHLPYLVNGTQHDTNGKSFAGPFNPSGPSDIAIIHHYHTKSYKERIAKRKRGRADVNTGTGKQYDTYKERIDLSVKSYKVAAANISINDPDMSGENMIFDDSAWLKVKKYVSEYAFFDSLQQTQNSSRSRVITKNITYGTALCCIAIDEEAYIDEFIDYYHALGFDSIHVYDNSDENALKQWGEEKGNHVKVVHYPGIAKQQSAYLDCAKKIKEDGNYTWVAFFDIDEFLILKKHENIEDFLLDYLSSGTLAINWFMFLTSGRIEYSPLPVTKRFLHRGDNVNQHVKCIVKLSDMNMKKEPTAHLPYLVNGTQHDTNGKSFAGPFNPSGPSDIAIIHHYHTKSYKERIAKYKRGRADVNTGTGKQYDTYKERIDIYVKSYKSAIANISINDPDMSGENMIFDDSAWLKVKKYVPEYVFFDTLP